MLEESGSGRGRLDSGFTRRASAYNGALSFTPPGTPCLRILEEALTFDDVLLVPAHSDFLPRDVESRHAAHPRDPAELPDLSAAMDTVTEARLAITIAQEGGIGIVHKNMSIEAQAREVHASRSSRAA